MSKEKTIQFANFNITFGEDEAPMLEHFEDIIFPAFMSGYIRGKEREVPKYYFTNVKIKLISDEYIFVGDYIKDTEYTVFTTIQDGRLISSPAEIPTAPYSRFIIFLKNHRMILVKNESNSPDIRSFQTTVREILKRYINEQNKGKEEGKKLPFAIVNIVDIPNKDSIDEVFKNIDKIKKLKLRFFPLNNDLNPLPIAQAMKKEMANVKSKTGNIIFNSPDSKSGVIEVLEATGGLAVTTMEVIDAEGKEGKIKEGSFSSSRKIPYQDNIDEKDDKYFVEQAKRDKVISKVSLENASLYEKAKFMLSQLMPRE